MLPVFLALSNRSQAVCLMSSIQPTTTESSPVQKVVRYLDGKGKLEQWSGMMANQMLNNHRKEQQQNQAAESAFVRRQAWGEKASAKTEDDMGDNIILGDNIHPTPIVFAPTQQPSQQQSGSLLKTMAILAAGALIPGAGIAGYLASQMISKPTTETTVPEDQTLDLGLLRFEDLEPKEGTQK